MENDGSLSTALNAPRLRGEPRVLNQTNVHKATLFQQETNEFNDGAGVFARYHSSLTGVLSYTSTIPFDNTIPQITEGAAFAQFQQTPFDSTNNWEVRVDGWGSCAQANLVVILAMFIDGAANASAATVLWQQENGSAGYSRGFNAILRAPCSTPLVNTIDLRIGLNAAGNLRINQHVGTARFGGVSQVNLALLETG